MSETDTPTRSRDSYANVFRIAFPLVMASSGHALRLLADRIMLARFSPETIAASMPAGLSCFVLMCFFMGTAGYANTFVAQYTGADRADRAGAAIWQALLLALFGGAVIAALGELGPALFDLVGHAPAIREQEVPYFRVLCRLSVFPLLLSSLMSFWSGRGRTVVVMVVELSAAAINVTLNAVLIFGLCGMPRLGIVGAGLATGISSALALVAAMVLFLSPNNRRRFGTAPGKVVDLELLGRLVRFGLPNGIQFMLDLAAFNLFVLLLGRLGTVHLEAANMAFGLNAVAFMPVIGLGMTASVLVGQCIGAEDIGAARSSVTKSLFLALGYSVLMGLLLTGAPRLVLAPFIRAGDVAQEEVLTLAARCLRYITLYLLADALAIVYSQAIKGAGDTRFTMYASLGLSWGTLTLPCFLVVWLDGSPWLMWRILVGHVFVAAIVFYLRYRSGRWQSMRVIENPTSPGEPAGSAAAIELDRG